MTNNLKAQVKAREALEKDIRDLSAQLEVRNDIIQDLKLEKATLTDKLRDYVAEKETLQAKLKDIKQEKNSLRKRANDFEKTLSESRSSKNEQLKDFMSLKNEKEELENENYQLKEDNSILLNTNLDLKQKVKSEQSIKSKYKKEKDMLKDDKERCLYALNHLEDVHEITLKEKGKYTDDVRQLYMSLMGEANVSSVQASKTVQLVAKHLFHTMLKKEELPSPRSCINFMYEAHHIAKQHVASSIRGCNHFMYGSDGTSRQKRHYLEHHIVLDNGSTLSIGFSEVPDDKAETLLDKSINLIDELSDIYCTVEDRAEKGHVFAEILRKMKCMMSDRAANMKLFNKKMLEFKKDTLGSDASIEFLYCKA